MKSQKRSLFKRPAWAKISEGEEGDIFRRSNRIYSQIDQNDDDDDDGQDEQVLQSRNNSMPTQRDLNDDTTKATEGQPASAARQISSKGNETITHPAANHQRGDDAGNPKKARPASLVQGYNVAASQGAQSAKRKFEYYPAEVVDLEEMSSASCTADDSKRLISVESPHAQPDPKIDCEDLEADDFPELARLARQRVRRKRLEQDAVQGSRSPATNGLLNTTSVEQAIEETRQDDPTIQILVTSNIKHTQPLIVTRRLSQRLKDVKLAWIQHQRPECGTLDQIFLTWRGKRVYDVTSCQSLDLDKGKSTNAPESQELARIHMVAMTKDMFDHQRQIRDRRLDSGEDEDETASQEPKTVAESEAQIRIILQSRNYSDFKLAVKQSTPISKIVNVFRSSKKISPDQEIFLQFDGERLNVDGTVEDTDLADMDNLEVYVK